jgi:hypothetical protein
VIKRGRLLYSVWFITTFLSAGAIPAKAGCGLDIACAISSSVGHGAGQGFADSVRPLVTDIMEREAPALIAQLQAGIDHNILTAEQAGNRLIDYATNLLNKAADDILNKVQNRTQSLIDYAGSQTLVVEQKIFADVQIIIKQFDCEKLGVSALIDRQQKVIDENANDWITRIKFWSRSKTDEIQASCRSHLAISEELKFSDMQIPTSSKLWRCVRLAYVDSSGPATAILDAYNDVVVNGRASMCALQSGTDVALRDVTEMWISDSQSARAWERAIHGE